MKITGRDLLADGWTHIDADDDDVLEAWLLFCIAVAGKTAKTVTKSINRFLSNRGHMSPFQYVRYLYNINMLEQVLRDNKVGQYTKLKRTFDVVSAIRPDELRSWTPEQFEFIHGIGPKTSRFFIQSTREGTRYAVLDTHVLAWMREKGYDVPKSTPDKKKYARIEKQFLAIADEMGIPPAQLDADIWLSRAKI